MANLLIWYATHDGQTRKILERMVSHVPGYEVEWRQLAEFYRTRVIPYLGGFIVLFISGHAVELYFANGPLAPLVDTLESIFVDYGGPLYIIGSLLPRITDALTTIFAAEERPA